MERTLRELVADALTADAKRVELSKAFDAANLNFNAASAEVLRSSKALFDALPCPMVDGYCKQVLYDGGLLVVDFRGYVALIQLDAI